MWAVWGLVLYVASVSGLGLISRDNSGERIDVRSGVQRPMAGDVASETRLDGSQITATNSRTTASWRSVGVGFPKRAEIRRDAVELTSEAGTLTSSSHTRSTNTGGRAFFNNDVIKGILIGCSLVAFLFFAPMMVWCCIKMCARRKLKRFQSRKCRTSPDKLDLLLTSAYDVTVGDCEQAEDRALQHQSKSAQRSSATATLNRVDCFAADNAVPNKVATTNAYSRFSEACFRENTSPADTKNPFPPKSSSSAKSSVTVLENLAYEDLITSAANDFNPRRNRWSSDKVYDVACMQTAYPSVEYMNVNSKPQRRRRPEHAYETIKCGADGIKIVENSAPSPIQIKGQSKSEDVTIFPCVSEEQYGAVVDRKETISAIVASDGLSRPIVAGHLPSKYMTSQRQRKAELAPRASMYVAPSAINRGREPSPYLLRTWSAPNGTIIRSKPNEIAARAATNHSEFKQRMSEMGKPELQEKRVLKEAFQEGVNMQTREQSQLEFRVCKPRPRRRTKRKVRSKRRYLDERRRKRIQSAKLHAFMPDRHSAGDDVAGSKGQNRWPLPGVYFESSSSSSSEVFRFKKCALRRHKPYFDPSLREATLLEDIWSHLDEITQKERRVKESYSSRRASVSLTSSSDASGNVPSKNSSINNATVDEVDDRDAQVCSPGSTSDRGYFTYKKMASLAIRNSVSKKNCCKFFGRARPRSWHVMSGMSTLTDTGTGAWMSSTGTRYSSFSSSRNDTLLIRNLNNSTKFSPVSHVREHLRRNPYNENLFIPQIVLSVYDDDIKHRNYVDACAYDDVDGDVNGIPTTSLLTSVTDSYLPVVESYLNGDNSIYEELSSYCSFINMLLEDQDKKQGTACSVAPLANGPSPGGCRQSNLIEQATDPDASSTIGESNCAEGVEVKHELVISKLNESSHLRSAGREGSIGDDATAAADEKLGIPCVDADQSDQVAKLQSCLSDYKSNHVEHVEAKDSNMGEPNLHYSPARPHVVPEKSVKNYVVVTPSVLLRHRRSTSAEDSQTDGPSRNEESSACTSDSAIRCEGKDAADQIEVNSVDDHEQPLCVFMEMRV